MFNNIEKYKDEIKEILNKNRNFALIDGEIKDCMQVACLRCNFLSDRCDLKKLNWLLEEDIKEMKIAIYNNSKIYDKEINSMILFFNLTIMERIKLLLNGNIRYKVNIEKLKRYHILKLDESVKESNDIDIY